MTTEQTKTEPTACTAAGGQVQALVSSSALPEFPWPDPKPEDLEAEDFNLVWECIKTWDINVPEYYRGYCGATGNHVMQILFATGKRNITDYC